MRNCVGFVLLSAALAFAGCGGGGGGSGGGGGDGDGTGTLRILVTDAPFPYDYVLSASVVIREVQVHESDGDAWTTVFQGEETIDLVEYQNGITFLLAQVDLDPGTYDEVRLIVDAGAVELGPAAVVEDGNPLFDTDNGKLFFPSGAQTGIKVKIENDVVVVTDLTTDLLLDFDLSKNFVFNGPVSHPPGVKRVLFTPVVRATNTSTVGTLEVSVFSDNLTPVDLGDDVALAATVRVFPAGADTNDPTQAITTASSGADGRASFSLAPGFYVATAEAAGHERGETASVEVFLANVTHVDVTLAASGEITGTVMSTAGTDATTDDDVSVAGALVEIRPADDLGDPIATTTTDASGAFHVAGLTPGSYDVTVSRAGFLTTVVEDIAAALVAPGQLILLAPLFQDVTGTVTDATSTPIAAAISIENAAGVEVATAASDATGAFTLPLPTGTYTLRFDDGDAATTNPSVAVTVNGGEAPQSLGTISF